MSIEAVGWALQQAKLKPGGTATRDRLVLVYLANRYNEEKGACWPSVPTIAGHMGMADKTVRRALISLREQGLIAYGDPSHVEHIPADSRPNVWNLMMDADDSSSKRGDTAVTARGEAPFRSQRRVVTGDQSRVVTGDQSPQTRVDTGDQSRLVTGDRTDWSRVTTKPEENPNRKSKGAAGVKAVINAATSPTEPTPTSLDQLASQHFSTEKHPGAYGTTDDPRCHKHRNEPAGWFEPCRDCMRAKDIFGQKQQQASREETEATFQRQAGKHECTICDSAGFRLTYNKKTGHTRTTACKHTPHDLQDQQDAKARERAA